MNRIQKLLMTEYDDFDDTILIESPFAQVTSDGYGIKQVQLGLTSTKLFIATDVFFTVDNSSFNYYLNNKYSSKYIDPEIESLELLSIIPLHLISMNCLRKGQRQILKIIYCTKRTMYFEFGGLLLRNLFWNIWRDRIRSMRSTSTFNFTNMSKNDLFTNSSSSEKQLLVTNFHGKSGDGHSKTKHVTVNEENMDNIVPKALREFVNEYRMKSKSNISTSCDNSNSFNNEQTKTNKNIKRNESDISLLNDIRNNFVNKQNITANQQNNQVLRDVAKFFLGATHNNILENELPLKSDEKCLNYLINGCPSFTDSLSNTNNNINNVNNINSNEYLMNYKEIATK